MPEKVLIVEDEKLIRWSVGSRLKQEGLAVSEAESMHAALERLHEEGCDLVLLDYRLPDGTGLDVLERVRREFADVAVIMMSAFGTIETAVEAMKAGAFDFLTKPIQLDALVVAVRRALETTRLRREVHRLREQQRTSLGGLQIVGKSAAMREVLALVDKIRISQAATVLIEGESGTGKDLVAKAIHFGSSRADRPFVNITCSALPETLLESELFGHERGAFTDARVQKKGLLEISDGGSAFLDEIGEMGLSMQAKLLRFLEDKAFKRLGGMRDIHVDVRIIAATNRELADAVRRGQFRADLFYRLQVIPVRIPSLRDRREDIPLLLQHFFELFSRELRKEPPAISVEAMQRLVDYDWPGNIRELRNLVERIMILEEKPQIEVADLPSGIGVRRLEAARDDAAGAHGTLELLERSKIVESLEKVKGNQVQAARLLGITRDTLRYRMKKYGLLGSAE
jgi:DNA-binding NtrC family response regulator